MDGRDTKVIVKKSIDSVLNLCAEVVGNEMTRAVTFFLSVVLVINQGAKTLGIIMLLMWIAYFYKTINKKKVKNGKGKN